MEAVSLINVVDLSRCRKVFVVSIPANAPEEKEDDVGGVRREQSLKT
jgi:hypothetical protein